MAAKVNGRVSYTPSVDMDDLDEPHDLCDADQIRDAVADLQEAFDAWTTRFREYNPSDDSTEFFRLGSVMRHFESALEKVVSNQLFTQFREDYDRVGQRVKEFNKDARDETSINEANLTYKLLERTMARIEKHYKDNLTRSSSSGGGSVEVYSYQKELLRYGDVVMDRLFQHLRGVGDHMNEVIQMLTAKLNVEKKYVEELKKASSQTWFNSDQREGNPKKPFYLPLQMMQVKEAQYAEKALATIDNLQRNLVVGPLKDRKGEYNDTVKELEDMWTRKRKAYEDAKNECKNQYERFLKAQADAQSAIDRLAEARSADKDKIYKDKLIEKQTEKEKVRKLAEEEYIRLRKQQKDAYLNLCTKKEFILTTGLDAVNQAERKLQSAAINLFSEMQLVLETRAPDYRAFLRQTESETLDHNEKITTEIHADIRNSVPQDADSEFEQRAHPWQKDDKNQRKFATGGLLNQLGFKKAEGHTFVPLTSDETRYATLCMECERYVYEGQVCVKCSAVSHTEHVMPATRQAALRLANCDAVRETKLKPLKIFRRPLQEQPSDDDGVPLILVKCLAALEETGINTEGLYRTEGGRAKAQALCTAIEQNLDAVDLSQEDPRVIATVVKHFIRGVPQSLLHEKNYDSWMIVGIEINKKKGDQGRMSADETINRDIRYHLGNTDRENQATVHFILRHLQKVFKAQSNRMNPYALGVVFGPNLVKKTRGEESLQQSYNSMEQNRDQTDSLTAVTEYMIENYDVIFDTSQSRNSQASSDGTYVSIDRFAPANGISSSSSAQSLD